MRKKLATAPLKGLFRGNKIAIQNDYQLPKNNIFATSMVISPQHMAVKSPMALSELYHTEIRQNEDQIDMLSHLGLSESSIINEVKSLANLHDSPAVPVLQLEKSQMFQVIQPKEYLLTFRSLPKSPHSSQHLSPNKLGEKSALHLKRLNKLKNL